MHKLKQYIIRNYNLLFKKDKCYYIKFGDFAFTYGDIINNGDTYLICLGKGWFRIIN